MPKKKDDIREEVILKTKKHILRVQSLLKKVICDLHSRGLKHDASKLKKPELSVYIKYTPRLRKCKYGSPTYKKYLEEMGPALKHHYKKNDHHPEYHKNGITDMNLIQLIELVCDWKASSERQQKGNILESLDINIKRFDICEDLGKILKNTVEYLLKKEKK